MLPGDTSSSLVVHRVVGSLLLLLLIFRRRAFVALGLATTDGFVLVVRESGVLCGLGEREGKFRRRGAHVASPIAIDDDFNLNLKRRRVVNDALHLERGREIARRHAIIHQVELPSRWL